VTATLLFPTQAIPSFEHAPVLVAGPDTLGSGDDIPRPSGLPKALNPRATFLWWYFVPGDLQKAMLGGPALVVGLPNRRGDSTEIREGTADGGDCPD